MNLHSRFPWERTALCCNRTHNCTIIYITNNKDTSSYYQKWYGQCTICDVVSTHIRFCYWVSLPDSMATRIEIGPLLFAAAVSIYCGCDTLLCGYLSNAV